MNKSKKFLVVTVFVAISLALVIGLLIFFSGKDVNFDISSKSNSETSNSTTTSLNPSDTSESDTSQNSSDSSQQETTVHQHEYHTEAVLPTCMDYGYTTYNCSCGDSYIEKMPPLGHDLNGDHCEICNQKVSQLNFIHTFDTLAYRVEIGGCKDTDIIVPETNGKLPIRQIHTRAFSDASHIKSIFIPDTVTVIDTYAFYNCSNLEHVFMPDTIFYISSRSFKNCTSLTEITISKGASYIYEEAFSGCTNLTSITIPENVTTIGKNAFENCNQLIQEENGVQYVDRWVIRCDPSLTSVTLREGTIGIADYAFQGCTNLVDIHIPDSVRYINRNAFSDCKKLIQVEDGIRYVDRWAIGIDSIMKYQYVVREGTIGIGSYAFYDDSRNDIISIVLPDTVQYIGEYAFADCKNMKNFIIPEAVQYIGEGAFFNCKGLTEITIPNGVTTIRRKTFFDCNGLTSITLPETLIEIGEEAFYGCSSVTSFTLPNNVKHIGYLAFQLCCFTEIRLPASIERVEARAFIQCPYLKDIIYDGTMEEWNALNKAYGWNATYYKYDGAIISNLNTFINYTIHCTDGVIVMD